MVWGFASVAGGRRSAAGHAANAGRDRDEAQLGGRGSQCLSAGGQRC